MTSGWDLPEALNPGVLHDGAGRDGEGWIDGGVSRRDRWGPLALLLLGVVGAHPLSSQALDAGFALREGGMQCQSGDMEAVGVRQGQLDLLSINQ